MIRQNKLLLVSIIQRICGILFLVITLFIPFSSGITLKSSSIQKTFTPAFSFMFGGTISNLNVEYKANGISIISLIGYLLLILSFIFITISLFLNKKKSSLSSLFLFISSILIIISSIIFLCVHKSVSCVLADTLISSHSDAVSKTIYENTVIEFGFWGISIFGFISSFLLLTSLIFDGSFDKIRSKIGII